MSTCLTPGLFNLLNETRWVPQLYLRPAELSLGGRGTAALGWGFRKGQGIR